eukprot:sb/3479015/
MGKYLVACRENPRIERCVTVRSDGVGGARQLDGMIQLGVGWVVTVVAVDRAEREEIVLLSCRGEMNSDTVGPRFTGQNLFHEQPGKSGIIYSRTPI